jgi:hypothetical protein
VCHDATRHTIGLLAPADNNRRAARSGSAAKPLSPDLRQANRQGAGSGTRSGWAPSVGRPSHRLPKYCATGTDESRMLMLSATHVLPDPEYLRVTSSPTLRFASVRWSIPWRITV